MEGWQRRRVRMREREMEGWQRRRVRMRERERVRGGRGGE